MANYPQLDDCSGVWTLKEVNNAVMGGYWRNAGSRAIFTSGITPSLSNTLDYINTVGAGDAVDFGDLSVGRSHCGAVGSFNRAIIMGGIISAPSYSNTIDYVNFASTGNAADFGNLSNSPNSPAGASNSIRGLNAGGAAPGNVNTIDYITMSSTGNSLDFGDLTELNGYCAGASNGHGGL